MNIHAGVHKVCSKRVVMHTHMPYATALTLLDSGKFETLLSQNSMRFYNRVGFDVDYNGLALTAAEGERIALSMNDQKGGYYDVTFLGNHGVVVCGERIDCAYADLYYLERACQVQVLAMGTRYSLKPISDHELAARVCRDTINDVYQCELFFEALRRSLV